ncbi:hypothetical protein Taro_053970 [Colocasia esculenta]|uniref:Uncharacterized protein n=1 Tax=Colocasia esculenta TaxID=4460 RepID=A0A843XPB8_COLES|nr:hypothetical protein [Colocasia esculenta]
MHVVPPFWLTSSAAWAPTTGRHRSMASSLSSRWCGSRIKVDVVEQIASLQALLHSAMQDRDTTRRETEQLCAELTRLRTTQVGVSSCQATVESSQWDLEDRLASVLRRTMEAEMTLEERVTKLRIATSQVSHWCEQDNMAAASITQWRLQARTTAVEADQLCIQEEPSAVEVAQLRTQVETSAVEVARWRI